MYRQIVRASLRLVEADIFPGSTKKIVRGIGSGFLARLQVLADMVIIFTTGVMVEQGFLVAAEKKFGGGTTAFSPAADWHGKFTNEWVFDYNR